jgi:hypothetical protein
MTLQAFSDVLFQERRLLEMLLFKLETEHVLLETGRTRWLAFASREVDMVLDELNKVELARSVTLAGLIPELGLGHDATLARVVESTTAPWDTIFAEHQKELRSLMGQVLDSAESSKSRLREGYNSIRMALEATG